MGVQWEYKDFVWRWPEGWWQAINAFWPEERYRMELWNKMQASILPELRKEMDSGWEPISEIGPSSIQFKYFEQTKGNVTFGTVVSWVVSAGIFFALDVLSGNLFTKYNCASPTEVRIKLRRFSR